MTPEGRGTVFCCVVGLVLFGGFAWDEVSARGVWDGCELIERQRIEVPYHQ